MTALNKQAYRADGGDIGAGRLKEIADNAYDDEEKRWLAHRVLALLDELEATEKRMAELEARTVKLPTSTEVNGFQMLIEEEVIARLRESGVNPIVVRAAGIGVKGE